MNKINGGVDVLTRPNGQDARPTEWVINIVQLLRSKTDQTIIKLSFQNYRLGINE
jgi:hypothetical protein